MTIPSPPLKNIPDVPGTNVNQFLKDFTTMVHRLWYELTDGTGTISISAGDSNIDGGNASSVYVPAQLVDGGSA